MTKTVFLSEQFSSYLMLFCRQPSTNIVFGMFSFVYLRSCSLVDSREQNHPNVFERLAECGCRPHRVVLAQQKPITGFMLVVYA